MAHAMLSRRLGISPALAGGTVQVSAKRANGAVEVRVRDDGAGLAPQWQDGTGLANCRERLRHHADGRGSLEIHAMPSGTEALLRLPETAR